MSTIRLKSLVAGIIGSLSLSLGFADQNTPGAPAAPQAPAAPTPWLTGPLIAPTGTVVPAGSIEFENYVYFTVNTGTYNKHWNNVGTPNLYLLNPQIITFWGLTEWMDIQITPQFFYNFSQGSSFIHLGDLPIGLDFQLFPADADTWFPGIKFTIKETIPIGKYQELSAGKNGTDNTGAGTFATTANLVFYKVYHLTGDHFLSMTLSGACTVNAPVHVKGLNSYGGGHGTGGIVYPGTNYTGILSFEFTLNQNWVLALDNVYTHVNRNRFSGRPGTTPSGDVATVGGPSSEQLSFAPAIEYNFSSNFGIIFGAWVTATGRNSTEFRAGVVNIDITF